MATLVVALALCAMSAGPAAAHHIWIEQDARGARLYFGEFGSNLREDSPGLLDKLLQLAVKALASGAATDGQALTSTKTPTGFVLERRARASESLVAQVTGYPAFENKEGAKTIRTVWTPAARYVADFQSRAASLTLDIVPTGKAGSWQVTFQGKPLAGTEVEVVAQSGWVRTVETDAQGNATVALPWKGTYVIVVHHDDKTPGKRGTDAYDVASYVTTLSFAMRAGLVSPPAPSPAAPSE